MYLEQFKTGSLVFVLQGHVLETSLQGLCRHVLEGCKHKWGLPDRTVCSQRSMTLCRYGNKKRKVGRERETEERDKERIDFMCECVHKHHRGNHYFILYMPPPPLDRPIVDDKRFRAVDSNY